MIQADADKLDEVARTNPDRQPPPVKGLRQYVAYADGQDLQPIFVGVKTAQGLPEGLAEPIAGIWSDRHCDRHGLGLWIEADDVIAGRKDDALDPSSRAASKTL